VLKSLDPRPGKFIGFKEDINSCVFDSHTDIAEEYREGLTAANTTIKNNNNITLSCMDGYSLINTTKNMVSCSDGVVNVDFLGCKVSNNIPARIVYQAVAGDNNILKFKSGDNDCNIDWGDGSNTTNCPDIGDVSHNYAKAGDYNITISGNRFWGFNGCNVEHTDKGIKKLASMGRWDNNITSMENAFYECTILTEISPDAFRYLPNVTNFVNTFYYATSLVTIPIDLFRYNTKVNSFSGVFYLAASLASIPDDLFRYNPEVTEFFAVFNGSSLTSIPIDLFRYNTKVTSFNWAFARSTIASIPKDLFRYNLETINFRAVFFETPIDSIPEGLFDFNKKAINFSYVFHNCPNLKCSDITAAATKWPRWNAGGVDMTEAVTYCKTD
jgi:hypothetical protein